MHQDISKNYATEGIATALKAAREAKGLTQRALSKLSGVPQAHISKIESNAVDLRLSSLLALAHALGLDVTLLPRKFSPVVQSLIRTAGTSFATPQIAKDLARANQAVLRLQDAFRGPEIDHLRERLADIIHLQSSLADTAGARALRKAVEAIQSSNDTKALMDAVKRATQIRNALVHNVPLPDAPQRPAYQLEDDND
jgi:transcriptional regulator with XRE-family HTH domain